MCETDFSDSDVNLTKELYNLYDLSVIDSLEVLIVGRVHYLLDKRDFMALNDTQKATLEMVALEENLTNPVYVEIGEEGELIID